MDSENEEEREDLKHFDSSAEEEGMDSENEEEREDLKHFDSSAEEEGMDSENEEEREEREEIHKEVPRWSYKLVAEWELDANAVQEEATQTEEEEKVAKIKKDDEDEDEGAKREYYYDISSKKGRQMAIFNTQLEMKQDDKPIDEEEEDATFEEEFGAELGEKEALVKQEEEEQEEEQEEEEQQQKEGQQQQQQFPWFKKFSSALNIKSLSVRKKVKKGEEEEEEEEQEEQEEGEGDEIYVTRYSYRANFRRGLIKGSIRNQRRKVGSWKMAQVNKRSALCLGQVNKKTPSSFLSFAFSEIQNFVLRLKNRMTGESSFWEEGFDLETTMQRECINRAERWDRLSFGQTLRSSVLLIQSFVRKYIKLPFLIIAKNIGRMLFLQMPELIEDWRDWNREMHVLCTYNGVELSEKEFPQDCFRAGLQIKIVFPFRLKPWQGVQFYYRDTEEKENSEANFCFLTFMGHEAKVPFADQRGMPSFFKPIFEELKRRYRKVKEKGFEFLVKFLITKVFNADRVQKIVGVLEGIKKGIKGIIEEIQKLGLRVRERIQGGIFFFDNFKNKKKKSVENETNSIITNKENTQESIIPIPSRKNSSKEMKMKELIDRTITIRNQIEEIKKERNKIIPIPDLNRISPNKTDFHDQKSELWKHLWLRFKRRKTRFIRKFDCFRKFFMERIYTDLFLYIIIHMVRMNVQLFVPSIHKKINQEGADIAAKTALSIYNRQMEESMESDLS
jgi:chemotaxis protein histidine kinase CheA